MVSFFEAGRMVRAAGMFGVLILPGGGRWLLRFILCCFFSFTGATGNSPFILRSSSFSLVQSLSRMLGPERVK